MKFDKRKSYYLTIDTETANTLDDPLVYDIGGCIHDKQGNVYETFSFIIYEVFCKMRPLMATAYYAEKVPKYQEDIKDGYHQIVSLYTAKKHIQKLCKDYNVKAIIAHNARFDYRAVTKTQRYLTKSKYRYFLPYGIELWDTLKMARDTICKQKSYKEWAKENEYLTSRGQVRATAEILYRYITGNDDFIEEHTGLEDVLIEKEIFAYCMAQHQKMRKKCFS